MSRSNRSGFSLIEIMVATVILVMIVLIMAQLFHQSQVAWDSGMRKAEGNLGARAVVGFISRELQNGVLVATNQPFLTGAGAEPVHINHGEDSVAFFTFSATNSPENRVIRWIKYSFEDNAIYRWEEICTKGTSVGKYGTFAKPPGQPEKTKLIDGVTSVVFETPDGKSYTTNMPTWVRIVIGMSRSDNVSGIGCRSAGPDRKMNTDDDIASK